MAKSSTSMSLEAHVKDCSMFRKELKHERAVDRKSQRKMHDENTKRADKSDKYREEISGKLDTLTTNVNDLSGHVTTLKNKEVREKERHQKWMSVGQRTLIVLLFSGLAYTVWHIIVTKGLGP